MAQYEAKEWTQLWYDETMDNTAPRAMLIGDSITVGYTIPVNKYLDGRVHVDSIATSKGIDHPFYKEEIDLFARQFGFEYQAIHFNNGLHGWHLSPEEYEKLYEEKVLWLMERFPNAKLALVTSTAVVISGEDHRVDPERDKKVSAYNAAVWRIAEKYGLPVDDLYPTSVAMQKWRGGDSHHFNEAGKAGQAKIVGDFLLKLMNLE